VLSSSSQPAVSDPNTCSRHQQGAPVTLCKHQIVSADAGLHTIQCNESYHQQDRSRPGKGGGGKHPPMSSPCCRQLAAAAACCHPRAHQPQQPNHPCCPALRPHPPSRPCCHCCHPQCRCCCCCRHLRPLLQRLCRACCCWCPAHHPHPAPHAVYAALPPCMWHISNSTLISTRSACLKPPPAVAAC
jgi:hypothetical protein